MLSPPRTSGTSSGYPRSSLGLSCVPGVLVVWGEGRVVKLVLDFVNFGD